MFCGSQALAKASESHVHVKPAPCRSWTCETCAPRRKALFELQAKAGNPDAIITLTLQQRPGESVQEARETLGKGIIELMRRCRRMTGFKVEYLVAIEATKAGWPHAHVLLRWRYVHHKILSRWWADITGGSRFVWIERIRNQAHATRYLAKYLGKAPHKFGNSKRYWMTRRWLPADFGKPSEEELERWQGWRFVREHPDDVVRDYRSRGWFAHAIGAGETVLTAPPWALPALRGPPTAWAAGGAP